MITNAILQQMTGAVSFRRWLGCAPTIVARAPPPPPPLKRPRHRFLNNRRRANGPFRTTLGSRELAAPRPHETFTAVPLHDGANSPDGRVRFLVAVCGVVLKNSLAVFAIAQPNGVRLSCDAGEKEECHCDVSKADPHQSVRITLRDVCCLTGCA